MLHLPEHISRVYRSRRDGLRDGLACSACRRPRSDSSGRHMRTCILPKRVEYFSSSLFTIHIASIAAHNALFDSLLVWIHDRVRIKCTCTSNSLIYSAVFPCRTLPVRCVALDLSSQLWTQRLSMQRADASLELGALKGKFRTEIN